LRKKGPQYPRETTDGGGSTWKWAQRPGAKGSRQGNHTSHSNSRVDCSCTSNYLFFFPEETRKWSRLTCPSNPSASPFPFPTVTSLLSRSVTPPTNHIPPFRLILNRTSVRPLLPPRLLPLLSWPRQQREGQSNYLHA